MSDSTESNEERPCLHCLIGDADHVTKTLADLSGAGVTGIGLSLINYLDELPFFCAEVLPRLARLGLRERQPQYA